MMLIRDFALYGLPVLVAAGGWLYALSLRKQHGRKVQRASVQRTVTSCARTDVRNCS
ncbi:hypothetical protein PMI42_04171 [Bradyrhizobium sp. YR681]|uniref:hypothetical protein n=1 Tax=Bradyrhizobium sp. YR681 TaxID=1144344 RepID=UPI0002710582|nr:hypothetical protein [Bradyrhizobium sp. YR681]EJN12513.1 hypothetical protein PMI42_04171 [Bradyrhizobium sp. YR681]